MDKPELRSYQELLQRYEQERSDPEWQPVHLGFGTVDAEIRGISPGQVLGIAARSAVGKTWFLESIEHNFSARTDAGQVSLSIEMPGEEWAERALAIHEGVAPEQVEAWAKSRQVTERSQAFVTRYRHSLVCEDGIHLEQLPGLLAEARSKLNVPLRLLLIDYLGLLDSQGRDTYERVSRIGKGLKLLAKTERIAIVVAMQLSRAGGDGSQPVSMEMLRDSGVLEESVDFLLGCWRPKESEEDEFQDDRLTVAILKNRKGRQGRWVNLKFHPTSRFLYEPADPFVTA